MNKNKLQQFYPIVRTREEVLEEINKTPALLNIYTQWNKEWQEYFLDFVTGAKGIKMVYDSVFKEILNPETVPERLNFFLSCILGEKVTILKVLPLDNTRMGDETSLVVMDIVVQLSDGRIVDVEIQKMGYLFPGQRCACYSSDLLLRQYKAARDKTAKKDGESKRFSYKSINQVYTIVLFEKSPKEFHKFPDTYLHHFEQKSDTGLKLNLLQKYIFIPLDIFQEILQYKGITNDLDAWLAFLCRDDPETICTVMQYAPVFEDMYRHLFDMCRNIEDVMQMFSKELQILDRNTVLLMIDEMQDSIDKMKTEITEKDGVITEKNTAISEMKTAISEKNAIITEKDAAILEKDTALARQQEMIADLLKQLEAKESKI